MSVLVISWLRRIFNQIKHPFPDQDPEVVNAAFFNRLLKAYPDLTKSEREICSMIKLNLSSKEIARLRESSVNSVNAARSRIRKKMGLTRKDELEAVLKSIW